jgi:tRNA(Glu) U13 pseudouridine synthase TruD
LIQEDFTRNRVLVCAYISNIFNSHLCKQPKTRGLNNFFDYEKWCQQHYQQQEDSAKKELLLLSKSLSTQHIPTSSKSKACKKLYCCFDQQIAGRMFGYRVSYQKPKSKPCLPNQTFKPIHKYC